MLTELVAYRIQDSLRDKMRKELQGEKDCSKRLESPPQIFVRLTFVAIGEIALPVGTGRDGDLMTMKRR